VSHQTFLLHRSASNRPVARSGNSVSAYERPTRQGVSAMRRHNQEAKPSFDRVSKGEKTRRKQAAVGLGRKVLIWCWALLRDERDWSASPPEGLGATAG